MSDEDLEKQFDYAGDEMNALLDQLDADGFNTGAVLGGAPHSAPVPARGPEP